MAQNQRPASTPGHHIAASEHTHEHPNTGSLSKRSQREHPQTHAATSSRAKINVVLFGETGVGKSSVINLIAREEVAKVSSDVNGCTMQSTPYPISIDGIDFTIFDTIGLEEPQMGVNGYLKAIEKAYELILKLSEAGGIHLLLFCMRGGRITATTQSNYRLFCECLCSSNVPVALVFTGLEREVELDDWWKRNKTHIEHYGIKSKGHACVTAVKDEEFEVDTKFNDSQRIIRDLLTECALKSGAYRLDSGSWLAKVGRGMLSFIEKAKIPRKRDLMKTLTQRCKLDPEMARKIADMIRSRDQQKGTEGHQSTDASTALSQDTPPESADVASAPTEVVPPTENKVVKDLKDSPAGEGVPLERMDSLRTDSGKDKRFKLRSLKAPPMPQIGFWANSRRNGGSETPKGVSSVAPAVGARG